MTTLEMVFVKAAWRSQKFLHKLTPWEIFSWKSFGDRGSFLFALFQTFGELPGYDCSRIVFMKDWGSTQ